MPSYPVTSPLTKRVFLLGASATFGSLLMGCGGGSNLTTYDLTAPRAGLRRSGGRGILVVAEPTAVFALDSERIVVRSSRGELTYLPASQWSDRLPKLLQARMIQTLENAGRAAVARPGDRLKSSYQLVADIGLFEIREDTRSAVIEIAAKIANSASGAIIAARVFGATAPVSTIDGQGATAALDQALAQVLSDFSAWVAASA
jgi:cholesterol transport system auxiliary component